MRSRTVITVAVLALATTAYAGEPRSPDVIPQKARALAAQGRAFHNAGDYGSAIVAFKEAYVMAPSPGLLFNLAQAYRLAGNCDDAALMYRRYLNTGPSPDARLIAEAHLAGVERCVHKQGLNIPVESTTAAEAGALQPPGANGATVFGPPESDSRSELKQNVGIGLTIAGGIALSAAAYFAFDARTAASSVEDAYARGAKWKDIEAIDQRGERSERNAAILGIGGGLAVVSGVTLYVLGKRAERFSPIAVVPTKRGAQVSLAWQF